MQTLYSLSQLLASVRLCAKAWYNIVRFSEPKCQRYWQGKFMDSNANLLEEDSISWIQIITY